ncbi:hypothetical protein G3T36_15325 [Diaminobutyricibacter tongyongensis]|uniref:Prepilin peptidase n=1 Tax=Leifsonia tongyongensis TaxID=1268043 RepID=A0A6L9Y0M1_9MICO|nr:hypothetical protein [Diaminobutyricibacter tongyongensis]NEN07232.1 hypothetical protein [Diaminobutyricibacter tongyongensis]
MDRSIRAPDAVARVALAACLIVVGLRAADGQVSAAVPLLYLAVVTGELCRIDLAEFRLPNALVVPGLGFAAAGLSWGAFAGAFAGADTTGAATTGLVATGAATTGAATGAAMAVAALCGGAGYAAVLLIPALAGEAGMGDVKLAALLGLVLGALGPWQLVLGPVSAFVAAGVVALVTGMFGGTRAGDRIAFGPFMLGGFWAAVALSPAA